MYQSRTSPKKVEIPHHFKQVVILDTVTYFHYSNYHLVKVRYLCFKHTRALKILRTVSQNKSMQDGL